MKCYPLFILLILLFGCKVKKDPKFYLVNQKSSTATINGVQVKTLREYYVIKNYKLQPVNNPKIDSFALELGYTKGLTYDKYIANMFISKHALKKDSIFFKNSDSISIIKNRKNFANYFFKRGLFREKQRIVNGNIMPPLYDSVKVKFELNPMIRIDN